MSWFRDLLVPSHPVSRTVFWRVLKGFRASSKKELFLAVKDLLIESQRDVLELLTPETRENENEDNETLENEYRKFWASHKSVKF